MNRKPILRLCKSFIYLKLVQNDYIWIQLGSLQTTMPENLKWKQRLTWSSSLTPVFLSSRYLKTLDTGFWKELTQEIKDSTYHTFHRKDIDCVYNNSSKVSSGILITFSALLSYWANLNIKHYLQRGSKCSSWFNIEFFWANVCIT